MFHKKIILALLFLSVFLLSNHIAQACSCAQKPTVLDAFESSENVIIAEIIDVVKAENTDEYYLDGIKGAKMSVKKVFNGSLKEGDEIFFAQGGGADCIWTYRKEQIGTKVLIYDSSEGKQKVVFSCGRSGSLKSTQDDLLYLENINKVRGKTRISGQVGYGFNQVPEGQTIEGKRIKIVGKTKTYFAKTDKNGIYEIYNLPAGQYYLQPEIPQGWKIDEYWFRYSPSIPEYYEYLPRKFANRYPIMLEKGKHASLDFYFEIDNAIHGRVVSPTGKPIKGICVSAVSAEENSYKYGPFDCTDEKGIFSISELYRKSYVLVINGDEKITAKEPTGILFYPGVKERSKAAVINIDKGKQVTLSDFRIPKLLETVTLRGTLYFSDGKIITDHQKTQFIADEQKEDIEGKPYDYSDDNGRFEIKIMKGQRGKIRASIIFGVWQFQTCPEMKKAVINENAGGSFTVATDWLEIDGDKDMKNIKLIFPFPECKRTERPW